MSYQYVNTKVFHLTGEVLLFRLRLSSDCEGGADPEEVLYLLDREKRGYCSHPTVDARMISDASDSRNASSG